MNVTILVIAAAILIVVVRSLNLTILLLNPLAKVIVIPIVTALFQIVFRTQRVQKLFQRDKKGNEGARPKSEPEQDRTGERRQATHPPPLNRWTAATMAIAGALIALVGIYITYRSVQITLDPLKVTTNWSSASIGLLTFLIGAFFIGVPLAGDVEHPLPAVQFTKTESEPRPGKEPGTVEPTRSSSLERGWLVAHTDGYWHYFDQQRVLRSVPDSRVAEARLQDRERG
jgi:hypothetical protein